MTNNSSSDEDPIVMYLVVRESLDMSIGKTAAQVGHAVGMLDYKHNELCAENDFIISDQIKKDLDLWYEWNNSLFRKVVLKADDKEWEKIKGIEVAKVIVVDAGLTEIKTGSETVIGFWPMHKSQRPIAIKRLQLLK